jgi:hypothetical protein
MTDEVMISGDTCRHCGAARPGEAESADLGADWLCSSCERWQDSMTCPTCGSQTRISTMPPDLVPPAAKAQKE